MLLGNTKNCWCLPITDENNIDLRINSQDEKENCPLFFLKKTITRK